MSPGLLGIYDVGLITSVGLNAASSCAAIRAKVSNPTETRFIDSNGDWIAAHYVPLLPVRHGVVKLASMASMAISECLSEVNRKDWPIIPIVLCVAEPSRPGRDAGIDDWLFSQIQDNLRVKFSADSLIVPHGRTGIAAALKYARQVLGGRAAPYVVIAAVDSLINSQTLRSYEDNERLLKSGNSDGFIPGEGAAAILLGQADASVQLTCTGIGCAREESAIRVQKPLRGEGLASAIKAALAEAQCNMHEIDFRITDLSGEQYYFKEATLAVARILRVRKEELDIWHPAECVGELGAVAGLVPLAVANASCRKKYARGTKILCHWSADSGDRAAVVLSFKNNDG